MTKGITGENTGRAHGASGIQEACGLLQIHMEMTPGQADADTVLMTISEGGALQLHELWEGTV